MDATILFVIAGFFGIGFYAGMLFGRKERR